MITVKGVPVLLDIKREEKETEKIRGRVKLHLIAPRFF